MASVYSMVSARSDLHVSQTVALQLLFDLNFVSQCMVAGGSTAIAQVGFEFGILMKIHWSPLTLRSTFCPRKIYHISGLTL